MKKIIRYIIVVIALCIIGTVGYFYLTSRNAISITDDATVLYSGVNGYGSVTMQEELPIRSNTLVQKLLEEYPNEGQQLLDSISCTWQNDDGSELEQGTLTNGRRITYACTYDVDLGKQLGYSFQDLNTTYTVSILPDGNVVDFFEGLEVDWQYINKQMQINIDDTNLNEVASQFQPKYSVTLEGSVAKVIVTSPTNEELISYGYTPIALENEYNIGSTPTRTTNINDDGVIQVIQDVTKPLIEQAINNCGTLKLNGGEVEIYGYQYYYAEVASDEKVDCTYVVSIPGRSLMRSYAVDVFQMEDGTYRAYTDEVEQYTNCEITSVYNYWTK